MATFASPRGARCETPSLAPVSGFGPAVMALARRLEDRMIVLFDGIEARREAAAQRRLLGSFDDRRLADLGLSRTDVERF